MQTISYTYTQSVASGTWTIHHNLGCKPVVDVTTVYQGVNQKIFPLTVVHTDDNTMTITFSAARTGQARLVGLTTDILRSPTDSYFPADGSA